MAKKKVKSIEDRSGDAKGKRPLRLEYRSPSELEENPNNWRTHPVEQTAALGDLIGEVGWAGACLFNERTGRLIDGHARRQLAIDRGEEVVPVLVGDWSPEDEAKILAMLDPIAAMAERDGEKLAALIQEIETESAALSAMMAGMILEDVTEPTPPEDFPEVGEDIATDHECPKCGYRFSGGGK